MKAAYIKGREFISLEEVNIPQPDKENNTLVKVLYCGICGSDIPKYFGNRVKRYPLVLGHEFCGIVEQGPKELLGKLVAIKPKLFCGTCENCLKERYNLCLNTKTIGSDIHGGFQQYTTVSDKYLFEVDKLRSNPKLAALLEPLSIGVHACKFVRKKSNVAIIGNGAIGNMVRLALKYLLNLDVDVIGKGYPINTKLNFYDTIFECSGSVSGINSAIKLCKYKGDIIQIGILYPEYVNNELEFDKILRKELSIKGSWDSDFNSDWDKSYELLCKYPEEFEKLITSIYSLEDINNAFNYKNVPSQNIKVMVKCNEA